MVATGHEHLLKERQLVELSSLQFQDLLRFWGERGAGAIVLHSLGPETSPYTVDTNGNVSLIQRVLPQGLQVLSLSRLPRMAEKALGYTRGSWGELEVHGKPVSEWRLAAAGLSLGYASTDDKTKVGGVAEFGVLAGQLLNGKPGYDHVGANQLGCFAHNPEQMSGVPDLTVWLNSITQPVTMRPDHPGVSLIPFQTPSGYRHRFGVLLSNRSKLEPIAHTANPQVEWLPALMNVSLAMNRDPEKVLRQIEELPKKIENNLPLAR